MPIKIDIQPVARLQIVFRFSLSGRDIAALVEEIARQAQGEFIIEPVLDNIVRYRIGVLNIWRIIVTAPENNGCLDLDKLYSYVTVEAYETDDSYLKKLDLSYQYGLVIDNVMDVAETLESRGNAVATEERAAPALSKDKLFVRDADTALMVDEESVELTDEVLSSIRAGGPKPTEFMTDEERVIDYAKESGDKPAQLEEE